MDTDGSDDGADLLDFVVADNQATSSMMDSQATSPTSPTSQDTPRNRPQKPFYVPSHFPGTQESEGIPDVTTLVGAKRKESPLDSDDESGDLAARRPARGRRRLVDSDSDE